MLWRCARGQRIGAVFAAILWTVLATMVTLDDYGPGLVAEIWCGGLGFSLFLWWTCFIPYLELTETELIVRNRIGRHTIPISDIVSASAGYSGTTIRTRSGEVVSAWAVQKPRWATWLHKTVWADDVVAEIMSRVRQAGPPPYGSPSHSK